MEVPSIFEGETGVGHGLGLVAPVEFRALQVGGEGGHVRLERLVAAGLQHQHRPPVDFGQPVGQHGARRSGADHDEVVPLVDVLRVTTSRFRFNNSLSIRPPFQGSLSKEMPHPTAFLFHGRILFFGLIFFRFSILGTIYDAFRKEQSPHYLL